MIPDFPLMPCWTDRNITENPLAAKSFLGFEDFFDVTISDKIYTMEKLAFDTNVDLIPENTKF